MSAPASTNPIPTIPIARHAFVSISSLWRLS